MAANRSLIPSGHIQRSIHLIRGQRGMPSNDLTTLYQVEARSLVQAMKRNRDRFPADFMLQLTVKEFAGLKSQIVISSWGGLRRAETGRAEQKYDPQQLCELFQPYFRKRAASVFKGKMTMGSEWRA